MPKIPANAQDSGSIGTGVNWTNLATWTVNGIPDGASRRAFIGGTFVAGQDLVSSVTLDSAVSLSQTYLGFNSASGVGTLDITSTGALTNASNLYVGWAGGSSTLNLNGGKASSSEVWIAGNSVFNQDGANSTNVMSGRLIISISGGTGTYNMNDGYLEVASTFHVGFDTTNGTFNQSGGFVWNKGELWIGQSGANTNIYNMSGGTLVSTNGRQMIGVTGGTLNRFNHTGGTATFIDLQIAHQASVQGEYILNGGKVNTASLSITANADSKFEFIQGALNVNNVTLAAGKSITAGNGTDRAVITVSNSVTGGSGITVASNSIFGVTGSKTISTLTGSYLTMNTGAGWGGTGTLTGDWDYENGSTVAPGNSPGTFTQVGAVSFGSAGNYDWEINSFGGTAGGTTGWDLYDVDGTLTITATSSDRFNINLFSLTAANEAGMVPGFDPNSDYLGLMIAEATSIVGFSADKFNLNTAGFSGGTGTWEIYQAGNAIYLNYLAIPEPSTYAMLALGLAMSAYGIRISRKKKAAFKV